MANSFWNFIRGIRLKGEAADPGDNLEGSLWYNSTSDRLKGYAESAVREVATTDQTQTFTGKTLTGNTAANLVSGSGTLVLNTTGTATVPNATDTLVGKATTDTLTNKTLSGNTATSLVNGSGTFNFNSTGTITAPNATDTLVGKATTDTLTNKTFDADGTGNSITNIENADIKSGADIARNKLASGTINHVIINDGSGVMSSEATLAKSRGGTGADNSSVTFPASGTIVTETATETLTNKSLSDSTTAIVDVSDPTKRIVFDAAGTASTATTILSSQTTNKTLTLPDATDTLVGKATTDILTNKTINGSNNTITNVSLSTGVTGTLPIANGGTGQTSQTNAFDALAPTTTTGDTIYHNGTDNLRLPIGAANQVLKVVGGIPAWSTFSGGINYIAANPDAEADTSGWATYADAAGAAPVDGTGGSPNVTWTRTTSSPLRGSGSFLFTKDAANRQGQGVSFAFTADSADQAKVLAVNFDYTVASGTYADSDLTVYLYDVTNSLVIQPSGYQILNGTTGLPLKQRAEFQTASNSTSYRLIFHVASTSASAYTVKVDNVFVGPTTTQIGAFVGDWITTYVPTLKGTTGNPTLGTVELNHFAYRRVGDSMEFNWSFSMTSAASVAGSGSYYIELPPGLTADVSKFNISTNSYGSMVGTGDLDTAGVREWGSSQILKNGTNNGFIGISLFTGNDTLTQSGWNASGRHALTAGTAKWGMSGLIPVVGWSSGQVLSSDTDTRVVTMQVQETSPTATITNTASIVKWTSTPSADTHGGYSTSTGLYTVPVAGYYRVSSSLRLAATYALGHFATASVFKNSVLQFTGALHAAGGVTVMIPSVNGIIKCVAGDTIAIYGASSGTSPTIGGNADTTYFHIERISGPAQVAASESVDARYSTLAGQSISDITATIVNYGTKTFDSHNSVTTGASWKFTAPVSGKYLVKASVLFTTGGGWAAGESAVLYLYKNAGSVSVLGITTAQATHTTFVGVNGSDTIQLLAGDTIDVRVYQASGGTVALEANATFNYVCVNRIGNY